MKKLNPRVVEAVLQDMQQLLDEGIVNTEVLASFAKKARTMSAAARKLAGQSTSVYQWNNPALAAKAQGRVFASTRRAMADQRHRAVIQALLQGKR